MGLEPFHASGKRYSGTLPFTAQAVAAEELGARAAYPAQYRRAHPSLQGEPIPGNPPPPKE